MPRYNSRSGQTADLALTPVLVLVQTGALPLVSSLTASSAVNKAASTAPYRAPTILISVLHFAALGWYTYDLGLWLAAGPNGLLAAWGLWAVSCCTTAGTSVWN